MAWRAGVEWGIAATAGDLEVRTNQGEVDAGFSTGAGAAESGTMRRGRCGVAITGEGAATVCVSVDCGAGATSIFGCCAFSAVYQEPHTGFGFTGWGPR